MMNGHIISYKGELVNLDNVIYAKPQSDSCIKPRAVWDELCAKAGVIFSEA